MTSWALFYLGKSFFILFVLLISLACANISFNSIISQLRELSGPGAGHVNLGWIIGRPIVASFAMAILTPILTKWFFAPVFRRWIEHSFAKYDHISNITLMVLVLSAFISIAAYAGTSVLFGAFLAGTFLTYLPSKHPAGPFVVLNREEGEREADKSPTFVHTFECYLLDVQKYLMEPLFFASIGFAIPFVSLWTGERIWKGVLYTLLMMFAKVSWLCFLWTIEARLTIYAVCGWSMGSSLEVPNAIIKDTTRLKGEDQVPRARR